MDGEDHSSGEAGARPERPQVPRLASVQTPTARTLGAPPDRLDLTGPQLEATCAAPPAPDLTGPLLRAPAAPAAPAAPVAQLTCPACQATMAPGMSFCASCGESLAPDPLLGTIIDERYQVVSRLGAGAMGAVYEVRHLRLGKRFAMKVIHRELCQVNEFVARFEREALSTSRLQHPNCILVTDFGHAASGELYLVMEFLEGQPLSALLDKPLPVGTALEITRQILLGVQHAHEAGVIHRDLKPDNVVRVEKPDGSWEIKVVDFGIAKLPLGGTENAGSEPLTRAGVVFGTPQYMAPEQALGGDVGPAADIYAIGAMLWRMLTGRHVFEADGHMEVLSAKLGKPAPPLDKVAPGAFSPSLQELLRRALERTPSTRISSATEMLELIDAIRRQPGAGLGRAGRAEGQGAAMLARRFVDAAGSTARSTGEQVVRLVSGWYRCEGLAGQPGWPARARSLITTPRGVAVLGMLVAAVAFLLVIPALLFGEETEPPVRIRTAAGKKEEALPRVLPGGKKVRRSPGGATQVAGRTALERAQILLGQGACREAHLELQRELGEQPRSARGHYLLGAALYCQKLYREGLTAYAVAISLDHKYRADPRVLEDAERLVRLKSHRQFALEFLEKKVGDAGLPVFIRLAGSAPALSVRRHAIEIVTRLGAANKVDWLSSLALDLRQLKGCAEKGEAVEQLRQLKDVRAIPILRSARDERAGWFGRRMKNWCIREKIVGALRELQALPGADAYR